MMSLLPIRSSEKSPRLDFPRMEADDEPWVAPEAEFLGLEANTKPRPEGAWAIVVPSSALERPLLFSSLLPSLSTYHRPVPNYGSGDSRKPDSSEGKKGETYKELREGEVFLKDGIFYEIRPTVPDGACPLHALLGRENEKGVYQYGEERDSGLAVRMLYVQQFCKEHRKHTPRIVRLLVDFLKDYQEANPSKYVGMIFGDFSRELTSLREKQLADKELLYEEWVQKREVLQAYLRACAQNDYWFSIQEIKLAAHLFNKRVKIFYLLKGEVGCEEDGPEDVEEVPIFIRGNHFSRCKTLPSRTYEILEDSLSRGSLAESPIMEDHFPRFNDSPPPLSLLTARRLKLKFQATARKVQNLCVLGSGLVAFGTGIGIGVMWGSRIDDLTKACIDYLDSTLPRVSECKYYEENERTLKITFPIVVLVTMATSGCVFQKLKLEFQRVKTQPLQERSIQKVGDAFSNLIKWFFGIWLYRGLWGDQHDPESWNAYYKCQETAIYLISFELGRNIHNRWTHGKRSIRSLQEYKDKISTTLHRFPDALSLIQKSLGDLLNEGCAVSTRLLLTNLINLIKNQRVPENLLASQENEIFKLSRLLEDLTLARSIVRELLAEDSKEAFSPANREELRQQLNELEISLFCARKTVKALIKIYQDREDPLSTLSSNLLLVAVSSIASIAFLGFDVETLTKELFIALGTRPWGQLSVDHIQKRKSNFLSIKVNEALKKSHSLLTFIPFYFYARNFSSLQVRGVMMASIGWLSGVKEAFHEKLSYSSKGKEKKRSKNMLELAWIASCIGSGILLLTTGWPKCHHSNPHNCAVALGVEEQWINLDGKGCGATLITAGVTHLARKAFRFLGGYYSKFNNLVEWMDRWTFELRLLAPYFGFNSAKHLEEYDAYVSYNPLGFAISLGLATGIYTDQAFNAQHPEEGEAGEYSDVLDEFMEAFAK